jgi:hypothetical protein
MTEFPKEPLLWRNTTGNEANFCISATSVLWQRALHFGQTLVSSRNLSSWRPWLYKQVSYIYGCWKLYLQDKHHI